jgi:predicted Zn-dependent peptidase
MTVEVTKLANGMTVATDVVSGVETAAVGVWVAVGARHETADVNGVSHMLEHMAFKGTKRRTALDIVEEVEDVGGQINAYTSRENTAYYLRVMAADVPMAVDILADILQNSTFDPEELERERAVIIQEIGQCDDTPDDVIFDYFQETAFPAQALGRPILGSHDLVSGMTREAVAGYMSGHYGADRMVLAAAGKVDHAALVRLAEEAFAGLPKRGPTSPDPARYSGGDRLVERDLEQVHLVLGFDGVPYDHPDYYTISVLSSLLGGGMSSRLFQEVREKRGLVYSIYTFASSYRDGGLFGIYAGTSAGEIPTLMPVLSEELRKVGGTVTEVELKRTKAQLKAGLLMALEHTRGRAERIAQQMLIYGRPVPAEEIVARIDAVDIAAISRLAGRIFSGRPTVTALGRTEAFGRLPSFAQSMSAAE